MGEEEEAEGKGRGRRRQQTGREEERSAARLMLRAKTRLPNGKMRASALALSDFSL